MKKNDLRKLMLAKRERLSPGEKREWEYCILNKIVTRPEFERAKNMALYFPIRGEVNLLPLLKNCEEAGKRAFFPKVKGRELEFIPIFCLQEMQPGFATIPEPDGESVPLEELDLILVPGVAYDLRGYRLGMGGGFYDRVLQKKGSSQMALGVAFQIQIFEELPIDWWDQRVDLLITERLTLMPATLRRVKRREI